MQNGNRKRPVTINRSISRSLGLRIDRRETSMYSLHEAAKYIGLPESTLHSWVFGRPYVTRNGTQQFRPLIQAADPDKGLLSFFNLVEAHILLSTRQVHGIRMDRIRMAIDYVRDQFPANSQHPLITQEFYTDGKNLFVKTLEETINASRSGQLALSRVVDEYLDLIERDVHGLPIKLFPKTGQKVVVLNPGLSSGRPVLKGTGVLVSLIAQRVEAGERVEDIARNYAVGVSDVETAIEYIKAA